MIKYLTIIALLASTTAFTQDIVEDPSSVFFYDIFSEGEDIGEMSIQIIGSPSSDYVILENSHIRISGWWGDIDIRNSQSEEYSITGMLLKADSKTLSGKKIFWTKIKSLEKELLASFIQVENLTEQEEEIFSNMIMTTAINFNPRFNELNSTSQPLSADNNAFSENTRFPRNSYDTTFSNLPIYWKKAKKEMPEIIKVLDSENLSIDEIRITYLGLEDIEIGASNISAHHYKMIPEEKKHIDIWLAVNHRKTPYFVQLAGEDEDGPFHIKLKSGKGEQ